MVGAGTFPPAGSRPGHCGWRPSTTSWPAAAGSASQSPAAPGGPDRDGPVGERAQRRHVDVREGGGGGPHREHVAGPRGVRVRDRRARRWSVSRGRRGRRCHRARTGSVRRPAEGAPRRRMSPSRRTNGATWATRRRPPSTVAGAPVSASMTVPCARTSRPPNVTSIAAARSSCASSRAPRRNERAVGGTGPADADGGQTGPAEVLDEGERAGRQHLQRRAHGRSRRTAAASASTKRTTAPGSSSAGGSRSTSQTATSVCPISCQPPGEERG